MKKFISMLAGVVMASSMVAVTAFAAGGNPNWSMTIDKEEVEIGDIVTVTLATEKKSLEADIVNVYYDTSKFEAVDVADADGALLSAEEAEFKFASGAYFDAGINPARSTVAFSWLGGGTEKTMKANEEFAYLTFKAIAAGDADFRLKEQSAGTDGFEGDVDVQTVVVKGGVVAPTVTWNEADASWAAPAGKKAIWWPFDFEAGTFPGHVFVEITDGTRTEEIGIGANTGYDVNGAVSFAVAVILDAEVDATNFNCAIK